MKFYISPGDAKFKEAHARRNEKLGYLTQKASLDTTKYYKAGEQ